MRTIEEVLAGLTPRWMEIPGVAGVGLGEHGGRSCILVLTSVDPREVRPHVPESVEGHPVVVEGTGEIRALDDG